MNKRLVLFAMLLIAFIVYTRIRYHAPFLYSWDSVSFALSTERFDMRLHQPHPPGYILYSYTIRLVNRAIGDPNLTMIYLNIAATVGACWFIAQLVNLFNGCKTLAAGAAALYATNPIVLFYGSVAEIYAIEGFWVACIAYLICASYDRPRHLIWASAAMAIAGGFRVFTEVFLFPLYAAGFLRKQISTALISISILLIGNLLWFWPLVSSVGGLQEYFAALRGQSQRAAEMTADAPVERITWEKIPVRLLQTITLPVLAALVLRVHKIRLSRKESFLFLAILPPLALFSFVHFPKDGYLLLVIPLIITISVVLLGRVFSSKMVPAAVILLSCLLSLVGFLWPLPTTRGMVSELTRPNQQMIENRMQRMKRFFEIVEGLGGGQRKTFVLENRHYFPNWRMLLYYYPDDTVYLVWSNKRRAFVADKHEYKTIQPPLLVPADTVLVAVGKTSPDFSVQTFQVDQFRYYFAEARSLPEKFQLYSMRFMVSAHD